jgi:hypothetical protein
MRFRYEALGVLGKAIDQSPGGLALLRAIKVWTLAPTYLVGITSHTLPHEAATHKTLASHHGVICWEGISCGYVSTDWGNVYSTSDTTPPAEQRRTHATKNWQ